MTQFEFQKELSMEHGLEVDEEKAIDKETT